MALINITENGTTNVTNELFTNIVVSGNFGDGTIAISAIKSGREVPIGNIQNAGNFLFDNGAYTPDSFNVRLKFASSPDLNIEFI